jgi:hypothetical protein
MDMDKKIEVYCESLGKVMMDSDIYLSIKRLQSFGDTCFWLTLHLNYNIDDFIVVELGKLINTEHKFLNDNGIWKEWKRVTWNEYQPNEDASDFFELDE